MSQLWQHPFVNVFKHLTIQSWKKSSKEGEVTSVMDKTLKCTVYKVNGSIPAGNYILLPKTTTQSLGLTGRYMYLAFRPVPSKYFVVHIDVTTQDGLIVRISFSNLFKEFKSTSTWLQFPFVCNPARGSVSAHTSLHAKDQSGPAPMSTRWTMLCLDFQYILSMYLNRKYAYMKSVKLCANMLVKNIYTSDQLYEPGLTFDQVKKTGLNLHGFAPMPREMQFPLSKTQQWHQHYDLIRFPSDGSKKPFDSIQYSHSCPNVSQSGMDLTETGPPGIVNPKRVKPKTVHVSRAVSDRVALIDKVIHPKQSPKRREVVSELPMVGVDGSGEVGLEAGLEEEVHVYAHPKEPFNVHSAREPGRRAISQSTMPTKKESYKCLKPDPIIQLRRIVGFGGASYRDAVWTSNGTTLVYPCHAVIVAMQASNGHQRFFIGHTDKVSAISLNGNSSLLASGQTGQQSVVRVWKFNSAECLAMFKTHVHSLQSLSMSQSGGVLCGVAKDGHGKNMVVIWNTERVTKGGQVTVMAKAHTDVDIVRMRIAAFDDTRMVSCGRDNIRLWRVKDGSLRSVPVNLGEHHMMEFTDCCFEAGHEASRDPLDRLVYVCSKAGHIIEVDYRKVAISHVRRLLPVQPSKKKEKQTFNSGSGIAISSMCVNEAFCVTGSDDGFLRLWPLDFKHVYLEAEHEGPVTAVDISTDGIKILCGTSNGTLGILDVSTRGYTTVMRSHTSSILSTALDPIRRHLATVSEDHTIRVWDLDTLQQLYDFSAPKECPCAIAYHPSQQVFACGFESGAVRVFNVASTSLLAEHKQHRGRVIGVAFSPSGDHLYSAGSLGSVALYDASDNQYQLLRLLGNTVARGEGKGPDAITVSPDGKYVAFVGPSDFTVSVVEARSLDEVLRIDITSLNPSADSSRAVLDTAVRVKYAPANVKQLLVTTSNNKLLKFDARNGRILSEIDNIHRAGCTSLDVSVDGRHLATAGDRVVKIWDYHMRMDLNFQVFIGHSEPISQVIFTPDSLGFISTGEGIYFWDFLANVREPPQKDELMGRSKVKNYYTGREEDPMPYKSPVRQTLSGSFLGDTPRKKVPKPVTYEPGEKVADLSDIHKMGNENDELLGEEIMSVTSDKEAILIGPELNENNGADLSDRDSPIEDVMGRVTLGTSPHVKPHHQMTTPSKRPAPSGPGTPVGAAGVNTSQRTNHQPPSVYKHFKQRQKTHALAQRRYTAPPNQAGLKLHSMIGYNGNGRDNMVWHPDSGIFAYTSGCTVILEDLNEGSQQHLQGHNEEVSCLALQHDCLVLASASGSCGLSTSQICVWDLDKMLCKKVLTYHLHDVVCLAYSRDDRFMVSVGDYRECTIVVWSAVSLEVLTTTRSAEPVHQLKWDPFTVNEFTSVGENGTVLFWLLDETGSSASLDVHEADIPEDLLQTNLGGSEVTFTCLEYAGDSTLFIGTNNGKVSAWDTRENSCFMHWDADVEEIDTLVSRQGRLVTGCVSRGLRLWSVVGVGELRLPGDTPSLRGGGLTMEDEMNLDGAITSAAFDDTLDMGIVGTSAGTLWYINWPERASIRLVSGHTTKINGIALCNDRFLATCSEDGSLRVWSVPEREQSLQFQVVDQACNCVAFSPLYPDLAATVDQDTESKDKSLQLPNIVAGYSDGTVRMFDLRRVEMVLKLHPHAVAVTAISFSGDGHMILSGGSDGLVAISSPTTGMTVRVVSDHKGAPITCIDATTLKGDDYNMSAPQLWLATSADRRVSVWSSDWAKDFCELIDWLTFPAPAFTPDGSVIRKGDQSYYQQVPPSLAKFSTEEPDVIVYTGYGMQKQVQFHSMQQRKVIRTLALTHWASCLEMSPVAPLVAVGSKERLLKLMDYYEGSFQDFTANNDAIQLVKFSPNGKLLVSAAHNEILVWEVLHQ